jgi:hypothetical protein
MYEHGSNAPRHPYTEDNQVWELRWEDAYGASGCTLSRGGQKCATDLWENEFKPYGFVLLQLVRVN